MSSSRLTEFREGAVWTETLEWDSAILGIPSAKINAFFVFGNQWTDANSLSLVEDAEVMLRDMGAKFASCRICYSNRPLIDALLMNGWQLRDILAIYVAPSPPPRSSPNTAQIVDLAPLEATNFLDHFSSSFRHARMYRDPKISQAIADHFYRRLCERVLQNASGKTVGILSKTRVAGIAVGGFDADLKKQLNINLTYLWQITVFPEFRGMGLSAALLRGFQNRFQNADVIEIGTQIDNVPANRLYSRAGLRHSATAITLHKWFA